MSVTSAFTRRERALLDLAQLKADLMSIYFAHRDWDWGKDGDDRSTNLRPEHVDDTRDEIASLVVVISSLLSAPISSKSRHLFTKSGQRELARKNEQQAQLELRIGAHFCCLSLLVEELKAAGMPGNGALACLVVFCTSQHTHT